MKEEEEEGKKEEAAYHNVGESKKYDEEFKKRAVRMSYSSKRPVRAVSESLGATRNMIYRCQNHNVS